MTDKEKIKAEIERLFRVKEETSHLNQSDFNSGRWKGLMEVKSFIDSLPEEHVSEDLEAAADAYNKEYSKYLYGLNTAFKAGAEWKVNSLWKDAQGDDLPEIDREVVAFQTITNDELFEMEGALRVVIAHRPNPNGWDGKSLSDGKVEHYTPKTYDKGGWNMPDVKYWLDAPIPEGIE